LNARKSIPPIAALRGLFLYEPETGRFIRRMGPEGIPVGGDVCRTLTSGYRMLYVCGASYGAHILAWAITHGAAPTGYIDHINGQPGDNRLANLRDVSAQVNSHNRQKAHRNNKSTGLLGVTMRKQRGVCGPRFQARITVKGHPGIYLGTFKTAAEAHEAYLEAKRKLHPVGCTI
jgi:hypothetical protein